MRPATAPPDAIRTAVYRRARRSITRIAPRPGLGLLIRRPGLEHLEFRLTRTWRFVGRIELDPELREALGEVQQQTARIRCHASRRNQIGRASCRARVEISV